MYPDKSFTYTISFRFNNKGEYHFETVEEVYGHLSIRNEFNQREPLKIIESYKRMDTLGILLAPDGSIKNELKYLLNKDQTWV